MKQEFAMRKASRRLPSRVVVIGGSIAGMFAAAAVKDHVDAVDIVEAHHLPEGPHPRTGVPQAVHVHMLQTGGAEAIETLVPGSIDLLLAAGAHRVPVTTNMVVYSPEGWYRRWRKATHYVISASRDLTDFVVREQVLEDPRISVHTHTRAVGLLGGSGKVTGVRVRAGDGTETELDAELVIDASGRATRTPQWLGRLGITRLVKEEIDSGLVYASRVYQAPVPTRNWPVVGIQADPRSPGQSKAGAILPIEGDRWHVSLIGARGEHPTGDAEAFEPFARTLRHPLLADLLAHARPLTGVSLTHSTTNRRYRYERLPRWPEGLVVLGDSVAVFNPVYAQGISAAAQGALALRELLAQGLTTGLARRAQRAIARPIDNAWALATGQDIHSGTGTGTSKGRSPNFTDRLLHRYVSRLSLTATGSFHAATALTDVLALQAPPSSLVKPRTLLAAFLGPLAPPLDGPQFSHAERSLLDSLSSGPEQGTRQR
ncbi:FAD-dependent oxidoreductase [Streptomyces sp. NPDC100445]|uniref:FAD-dependent oxidoreductase n=1 Tax=Streptomyces sp. NPDC100445 TaxID=3366102 RepID=UPI0038292593